MAKRLKKMPDEETKKKEKILGPIEFLNTYSESPVFKERYLANNSDEDYVAQMEYFRKAAKAHKPFLTDSGEGSFAIPQNNPLNGATILKKIKAPKNTTIVLDKKQAEQNNQWARDSKRRYNDYDDGFFNLLHGVLPHEYSHNIRNLGVADNLAYARLWKDKNEYSQKVDEERGRTPEAFLADYNSSPENTKKDFYSYYVERNPFAHDEIPDENHADMNAIRYLMYYKGIYDTRKGPMSLDDFKKAQNDPIISKDFNFRRMLEHFTPEQIVELNNEVASNKSNNNDNMAKNGFKLNPKHKGWCTPMTKSTCTGKRRQFAINAKNHFKKKAFDGTELDPIDFSNHPKWLDTYQDPYPSMPGFQDDNTLAPVTVTNRNNRKLDTSLAPIEYDYGMVNKSLDKGPGIELATNTPSTTQPKQRGGYDGNIGNKLLTGLSLIDALIPGKKQKYNYLTPAFSCFKALFSLSASFFPAVLNFMLVPGTVIFPHTTPVPSLDIENISCPSTSTGVPPYAISIPPLA